ncbi:hypothetical protein FOMPIDRAFT_1045121 [Fomitopsis schrenkii]|uniref:Uncharacterized protein n=1 Tax=Fomitopsis schrenkii TaxID=2126942 RepID=S8FXG9_FOMSC|nr:hypothetical protein FOMPIDRAFT_1045121 [Fomitopsis schrenkii]
MLHEQVEDGLPGHQEVIDSFDGDGDAVRAQVSTTLDEAMEKAAALVPPDADPMAHAFALRDVAENFMFTSGPQPVTRVHIEVAMTLYQSALDFLPADNPARVPLLHRLIEVFKARSARSGDRAGEDLDRAIELGYSALSLLPKDDLGGRGLSLSILADCHQAHFELRGDRDDLDRAIQLHREALDLSQPGNPLRAHVLTRLTTALSVRYEKYKDHADSGWIVARSAETVHTPPSSPGSASRPGLVTSLDGLGEALTTMTESAAAVRQLGATATRWAPGDQTEERDAGALFAQLGEAGYNRFRRLGDRADLELAVVSWQRALAIGRLAITVISIVTTLLLRLTRFEQSEIARTWSAITLHREALELVLLATQIVARRSATLLVPFRSFKQLGDRGTWTRDHSAP